MNEDQISEMEAAEIDTSDNYFGVRHVMNDTYSNRRLFRSGFERGYKAAMLEVLKLVNEEVS